MVLPGKVFENLIEVVLELAVQRRYRQSDAERFPLRNEFVQAIDLGIGSSHRGGLLLVSLAVDKKASILSPGDMVIA